MNIRSILGFLPLILFGFVGHLAGAGAVGWVALAAAALGLGVAALGGRAGLNAVSISSTVVLAGLGITALTAGTSAATFVAAYGTGVLALLVGLTMLATVTTVPFTEQSARASVPKQYWDNPMFRAVNRRISLAWGLATIGCGLSRFLYVAVEGANPAKTTALGLLIGFGVPAALCYLAFRYTIHSSKGARARVAGAHQPTQ